MPQTVHNSELLPESNSTIDSIIVSLEQRLRESALELQKLRETILLDIRKVY